MIKKIARFVLGFPIWIVFTSMGIVGYFFSWLFDAEEEFELLDTIKKITKKWLSIDEK